MDGDGTRGDAGGAMDASGLELAELYDAVHGGRDDVAFWATTAVEAPAGELLELGCGTGRVLVPLARAGFRVTGLDLSDAMLERCTTRLAAEEAEVRERVRLVAADMASFQLDRRFSLVTVPFGGFQQLLTVEQQLACLASCRRHLLPGGRLVLDLPNVAPLPPSSGSDAPGDEEGAPPQGEAGALSVDWTAGRRIRWWVDVIGYGRAEQVNQCRVTYEVTGPEGIVQRSMERIELRYVFRFELEHLLARAGFRIVSLLGDYDRSAYGDESPAMIAVAEPAGDLSSGRPPADY